MFKVGNFVTIIELNVSDNFWVIENKIAHDCFVLYHPSSGGKYSAADKEIKLSTPIDVARWRVEN